MKKWVKILIAAVVAVVLLFILGVVIFTKAVDTQVYQSKIEQYLTKTTGRQVKILGKMQISWFPWIGLDVPHLTVASPQAVTDRNFADIGSLEFKLKVLPLLVGKVEIGTIRLSEATFNLVTNKKNQNNWSSEAAKQEKTADKKSLSLPFHSLDIEKFEIVNSQVDFIDEKAKEKSSIKNIDFWVHNFSLNKAFPIHLAFDWMQEGKNEALSVELDGKPSVDIVNEVVTIPDLLLKAKLKRPKMPVLPLKVEGDFEFNGSKQTLLLDPITVTLANMVVDENFRAENLFTTPRFTVKSTASDVDLGQFIKTVYNKDVFDGRLTFNSELSASGDDADTILRTTSGSGNIVVDKGAIKGVDLSYLLAKAEAFVGKVKAPASAPKPLATRFSKATASYKINKGIVSNNDLELFADNFKAQGKGKVNLVSQLIDYQLVLIPLNSNLTVPVDVSGQLSDPTVQPDWNALTEKYLKKGIEKIFNPEGLDKTIKSLFK